MRKQMTFALLLLFLIPAYGSALAQQSEGSKIIAGFDYPDIEWSVPKVGQEVSREVLDNGMILFMMEDHHLPLFNISVRFRCGEAYDSQSGNGTVQPGSAELPLAVCPRVTSGRRPADWRMRHHLARSPSRSLCRCMARGRDRRNIDQNSAERNLTALQKATVHRSYPLLNR